MDIYPHNKVPLFSIIIPTYNRNELLEKCLHSIQNQNFNKEDFEVIISDDGNTSKQLQTNFPKYIFIDGPRKGPAANRNNGAKQAKGEWLLFIDDDIIADVNLIARYSKNIVYATSDLVAVEGAIHPLGTIDFNNDLEECPVNISGGNFWSANVCIRKSHFTEINGFNEFYKIAAQEDQDIYIRLKKLGNVVFLSEAIVYHPIRKLKYFQKLKQIFNGAENFILFYFTNKKDLNKNYLLGRIFISNKLILKKLMRNILNLNIVFALFQIFHFIIGNFSLMYYLLIYIIHHKQLKRTL